MIPHGRWLVKQIPPKAHRFLFIALLFSNCSPDRAVTQIALANFADRHFPLVYHHAPRPLGGDYNTINLFTNNEPPDIIRLMEQENKQSTAHFIGRLDTTFCSTIAENILTDEVIITDERIQHIIERRGRTFYDEHCAYFPEIIASPDYIFQDNRAHTILVCKSFRHKGASVNLAVRLVVEGDNPRFKNSIITAVKEGNKRFAQRLRNKVPIFSRIDKHTSTCYNKNTDSE